MGNAAARRSHVDKVFSRVEDGADCSVLVASWRRCIVSHGLSPNGAAQPERHGEQHLSRLRHFNAAMTTAAVETLDHLIGILDGADYMIFLTDADGVVLETRTMRTGDFWSRPQSDWSGTDFSEATNGTNGVGTVLREGRPMTVAADQHFQVRDISVIGSGALVYGLDGEIAGCLDISSSAARNDPLSNSLMLAVAVNACRRIELRMLANAHPKSQLVMASRDGTHAGAVLAVDGRGGVIGGTRSARALLSLGCGRLTGDLSLEQLWGGERDDLTLVSAERRAIKAALDRHNGNTSAAARALGMSRSTLYRKASASGLDTLSRPNA